MKKIIVLVAPGFEEIEFSAPVDILRRLELDVVTAGVLGREVEGAHGVIVRADTTLAEVDLAGADALVLPGGPGSWVMRDTPGVIAKIQEAHAAGKLVAAICAAPLALGKAGILTGKKASAYPDPSVLDELKEEGVKVMADQVTVDGNIVTANGPAAALAFGYTLGECLGKAAEVVELKKAMVYA